MSSHSPFLSNNGQLTNRRKTEDKQPLNSQHTRTPFLLASSRQNTSGDDTIHLSSGGHIDTKKKKSDNDDDDDDDDGDDSNKPSQNSSKSAANTRKPPLPPNTTASTSTDGNSSLLSSLSIHLFGRVALKFAVATTVTLYILNQKHLLPKPLGSVVSRALFWPTLPITFASRIGKWISVVDDSVILGGAPFGFCNIPETLHDDYEVRAVVNMCEEYRGPLKKYEQLGMRELWLPTVDHFEPSVQDLMSAVEFICENEALGNKVYVHCRAGHGRSGAVALAWMIYKNPDVDLQDLNKQLLDIRNVRSYLWRQPNIRKFQSWVKSGGRFPGSRSSQGNRRRVPD